jgi:lipid-A-disaccharide synthase
LQKTNSNKNSAIKIVIITGELSGEIHASHLVKSLRRTLHVEFSGMGSKKLHEAGVHIIYDYGNISVTGISEIFGKLKYIREAYNTIKQHIVREKPSLLILVDFPGFNLRIAKFAKAHHVPVVYFIPPQVWAWRKSRIRKIRERVDKVICILPFEKQLYEEYGVDATYIGHPFVNTVKPVYSRTEFYTKVGIEQKGPLITILPGSRENEIIKHMPILLSIITKLEQHIHKPAILLPLAENIELLRLEKHLAGNHTIRAFKGLSYDALAYSDLAIAASGSVTLEAAILGTPTIVIYKISPLSYILAKILVNVPHISLPNIIAGKEIFPEFIQQLNPEKIAEKALYMLNNGRDKIKNDIELLKIKLGTFDSYQLAKDEVIQLLEQIYGTLPKASSIR